MRSSQKAGQSLKALQTALDNENPHVTGFALKGVHVKAAAASNTFEKPPQCGGLPAPGEHGRGGRAEHPPPQRNMSSLERITITRTRGGTQLDGAQAGEEHKLHPAR
jgi:hypothetical protein